MVLLVSMLVFLLLQGCAGRDIQAWQHETFRIDPADSALSGLAIDGEGARLLGSPQTLEIARGYTEAIVSFNAVVPEGAGVAALVTAGRASQESTWLRIASWGDTPGDRFNDRQADAARVAIDELLLETPATELGIAFVAFEPEGSTPVTLARADVVVSREARGRHRRSKGEPIDAGAPFRRCAVTDEPELSSRLCSPTSLGMLLAHRGAEPAYRTLIETVYDPETDLYGVWPRAIQSAFVFGVPGRLHRFGSWDEVRTHLETVGPIAISITAPKGTLRNAPYAATNGHLLVLTGLTENGDAVVLDPAVGTEESARRVYRMDDLSDVWLDRKRGTAYVLLPRSARP